MKRPPTIQLAVSLPGAVRTIVSHVDIDSAALEASPIPRFLVAEGLKLAAEGLFKSLYPEADPVEFGWRVLA